jgi:pimeloyl-ACP methyl ester carboxylesterase
MVLVATGAGYEAFARHETARDFPPNGRMIDIGGRSIHLDCRGTGSPTVVFESGLDSYGSLSWAKVQDSVATTTRACAYDRAGVMWSDPGDAPQNSDSIAADLHGALTAAGEPAPFVLVGHSLGGPYVMTYTKKYGKQVAGLVFVDASHPDQVQRLNAVLKHPMAGGTDPMLRLGAAVAWTGLPRLRSQEGRAISDDVDAKVRAYAPTSLGALLGEVEAMDETFKKAGTFRQLGDRPVVALTATRPASDEELIMFRMSRKEDQEYQAVWKSLHDEEASWSTRGRHELVPDSTHYIQFDRPDVVIAAVREVVARVRAPG